MSYVNVLYNIFYANILLEAYKMLFLRCFFTLVGCMKTMCLRLICGKSVKRAFAFARCFDNEASEMV